MMKEINGEAAVQDIGVQFQTKLGPGKLIIGYGPQATEMSMFEKKIDALSSVAVNNGLVCDMPLHADKKTGVQFIYITRTVTPDAENDVLKTVNTFIGAALYADF